MKHGIRIAVAATLAAATAAIATPAGAVVVPACSTSDLSFSISGVSVVSCQGGFTGNLNQGDTNTTLVKPGDAVAIDALNALGLTGTIKVLEKADFSGSTIDFTTLLSGTAYIGVHHGAANGQEGNAGNATSFYKLLITNPSGLDKFTYNVPGLSNAALYGNGIRPGVPEPATWAMMLIGFGAAGVSLRSRKRVMQAA